MTGILQDLRYAIRGLKKSPLFTVSSILSLAIGIAATTTIFGLADAMFFRTSQGVREAARVVSIERTTNGSGFGTMSYPVFRHLRDHTQTLASMAATTKDPAPLSMSDGTTSERVYGQIVSSTFFDVLQVRPAIGRFFRADEDEVPDARPVVVLSHRLWQAHFQSDPRVLDRPIRLNNTVFVVVGVAEAGFDGTTIVGTDVWVPVAVAGTVRGEPTAPLLNDASGAGQWHIAIGRLKPGVTRESAQAELNTLLTAFKADTPSVPVSSAILVARSGRLPTQMRPRFAPFLQLLFGIVCGLLAIACSNVGGMLLARAAVRQREMATRLALGASRGQLIGQMLIEPLLLFVAAGVVALPLAMWLASVFQALLPPFPYPIYLDLSLTVRTVLFVAGISLTTGIVFGLAPARHALKMDLSVALHGRSSTASRERLRLRHSLVVAQVALSLAVATTAGLFVRTLQEASLIDPGFRPAGIEVVSIDTSLVGSTGRRAVILVNGVAERLRTIGGVEAVAYARMIPLASGHLALGRVRVPGLKDIDSARLDRAGWDVVSPDYFRALGLAIVQGRAFTNDDRDAGPGVAIVNEAFARIAWPGQPAVGQRFWQTSAGDRQGRPLEVVGLARDAKYQDIDEVLRPFVYVPFAQQPQTHVELFVKHLAGHSISKDVYTAISSVEPGLPVVSMRSFEAVIAGGLFPQRLAAWIAGSVGIIGMFLTAIGLYGLVAFLVAQRTREIAIRMALGASVSDVRSMVLGQAARLGAIGIGAGVLLASGLGVLIRGLLVGVHSLDPLTFGGLALLMSAVLFSASYLPARCAAATDPAVAFRAE